MIGARSGSLELLPKIMLDIQDVLVGTGILPVLDRRDACPTRPSLVEHMFQRWESDISLGYCYERESR